MSLVPHGLLATPLLLASLAVGHAMADQSSPQPLPAGARLALHEDWSSGKIDPGKWYALRKKWGAGNHGVVPENVRLEQQSIDGKRQYVLVCEAHGEEYDGSIVGLRGEKSRVGAVIATKEFFASGRYEVVMKIGSTMPSEAGPVDPKVPRGAVPAIWTYGYRYVEVGRDRRRDFVRDVPLYNPLMETYGNGSNEYTSEIDFPEIGKEGRFDRGLYNVYCQNRSQLKELDVGQVTDGGWHTYTMEWRTKLEPFPGVADSQVVEHGGYWWIRDKSIPFERYVGNPLKRLAKNRYALYRGDKATHWLDGKILGENDRYVPAMSAQLCLGVWLPQWAGPAPWKTTSVSFSEIKIWLYDDPGDVREVLIDDLPETFDRQGREMK